MKGPALIVIGLIVLGGAGFAVWRGVLSGPAIELPDYTVEGMEPSVARVLSAVRRSVLDRPDDATVWANLGATLEAHELNDEAIHAYEQALARAPEDQTTRYNYALVLEYTGRPEESLRELQKVAAAIPDYPPVHHRLGELHFREGRNDEARRAFEEALRLRPEEFISRRSYGQVLLAIGDAEGAIRELGAVSRAVPTDRSTHSALAQALARAGRRDEALRLNDRLTSPELEKDTLALLDPKREAVVGRAVDANSCIQRAQMLERAGNFQGAIRELELAAEGRPDRAAIPDFIGRNYIRLQQPRQAIPYFDQAVGLDPERANAYHNRGLAREQTGDRAGAIEDYRRTLTLKPGYAKSIERLRALGVEP